jgi:formylglycine-generating enzyme required for sulfatase activity
MSRGRHPLADSVPEPWASEWGEDRFGIFMGFTVGEATQRLRWIPGGTFTMGSPATEEGRWNDEGPQHDVTIGEGYWLGDTPVTQALWEAVIRKNPSEFKTPDRPVEQVSWEDCQRFLGRLNEMARGLDARLPTEAEWERACRAGTTSATWAGECRIVGTNHAPVLDAIAWYGGNSGVGFELANGVDSSGWPEKQHAHTRAGTHPVAKKQPNPWGLHDMLGNVWEWCENWYGPYDKSPVTDPRGPSVGSDRVCRGGAWRSGAGLVRAAHRSANSPDCRYVGLGFRLARGQGAPG